MTTSNEPRKSIREPIRHRMDPTELIRIPLWVHNRHPSKPAAFSALSSAAERHSDARRAASTQLPGSPAAVLAADLNTTLDDRRVAHLLLMTDPACPGETIRPDDIERSGPCTAEACRRWEPFRPLEARRQAAIAREAAMFESNGFTAEAEQTIYHKEAS